MKTLQRLTSLTLLACFSFIFLPSAARATVFRYIGALISEGPYVDNSDWDLFDKGSGSAYTNYLCVTKPEPVEVGMTEPWLSPSVHYLTNDYGVAFLITSTCPADTNNLQKLHYRLISGDDINAASVTNPASRYCGFALNFCSDYTLANGDGKGSPIGTQVWQEWQGSGWAPLELRTDESSNEIRMYCLEQNDNCRGETNQYSHSEYLCDSSGHQLVFQKGQWYTFVIGFKFDCSGNNGAVKVWVNGSTNMAVDWYGQMGYTPDTNTDTPARCDTHFGLYQQDTGSNHRVVFDEIRFTDNEAEAQP